MLETNGPCPLFPVPAPSIICLWSGHCMGSFQHEPRVPDKGGLLGSLQAGQSCCHYTNMIGMKLPPCNQFGSASLMSRQTQPTYWAEKRKDKERSHMFSHLLRAGSLNLVPQNTSLMGCPAYNERVPRPIKGGKCSILQCLFLLKESVT